MKKMDVDNDIGRFSQGREITRARQRKRSEMINLEEFQIKC